MKTKLSTIRRIATAEGTTFGARRGLPLPYLKPAAKGVRTPRSRGTSSPAPALHIVEDEWQADPVLITQGFDRARDRHPTPASTRSPGSFATAFAHTPRATSGPNHNGSELEISRRERDRLSPYMPRLTDKEARHAAMFASTDGSAYVCWLCRTYGHAMDARLFLSPDKRQFTAYRNYVCLFGNECGNPKSLVRGLVFIREKLDFENVK